MSTRSRIAIEIGDKVKSIYCHSDGYPEGVGAILKKHYTDPEKIEKLMELGDLSRLGTFYDKKLAKMDWDKWSMEKEAREKLWAITNDMTVPYKDRGEDVPAREDSWDEFMGKLGCCGEEYTYIYHEDYSGVYRWEVCETPYFKEY